MKCLEPECQKEVEVVPGATGRKRHYCAEHRTPNARANRSHRRIRAGLPPLLPYFKGG